MKILNILTRKVNPSAVLFFVFLSSLILVLAAIFWPKTRIMLFDSSITKEKKEKIEKELFRQSLETPLESRVIKYSIESINKVDGQDVVIQVVLDTKNFNYVAKSNIKNGFSYVYADGFVCFKKENFEYSYCIDEKYSPVVIVRSVIEDREINLPEFTHEEETVQRMLMENYWIPYNVLASIMSSVEKSFGLLNKDQLKEGGILEWKTGNKMEPVGIIKNIGNSKDNTSIKAQGIDLFKIMSDHIKNIGYTFPVFDFENKATDENFLKYIKEADVNLSKYQVN